MFPKTDFINEVGFVLNIIKLFQHYKVSQHMYTFQQFLNEKIYRKSSNGDTLTKDEEKQLAKDFDEKFGKDFEKSLTVHAKEHNADIGFELTQHFKARIMWRYADKSVKDIKRIIKHIGLESIRKTFEYYEIGDKYINKQRSVLLYSTSKEVGIYVNYFQGKGDVDYVLRLITVLPPKSKEKSRSDDIIKIVESLVEKCEILDEEYELIYVD